MLRYILAGAAVALAAAPAQARLVDITVSFENLAPATSISFAPLRFGFNNGTFDAFDIGGTPTAPIISVAEGGSGSDWFPAFAAADPGAVLGSTTGPVLPGATTTSMTFRVDTDVNPFFTFGSMVVPSNDLFIGNDDPMEYRLFDAAGAFLLPEIFQTSDEIWNAGSELAIAENAAFLAVGTNDLRVDEGGVVEFSFSELATYNGLETAAGYLFNSGLIVPGVQIARISFQVDDVPAPAGVALFGLGMVAVGLTRRRRRTA